MVQCRQPSGWHPVPRRSTGRLVEVLEEIKQQRSRLIHFEDDGRLIGCLDRGEPLCLTDESAEARLRIQYPRQVALDVVARELASVMPLNAFSQVQLDLLLVATKIPAFGQHWLGLEIRVILSEAVVHQPHVFIDGVGNHVPIE